jgi:arylsulfatase A-like enzyme
MRMLPRALVALSVVALGCAPAAPPTTRPQAKPLGDGPSLAVLIVVDQARADYLERYAGLYTAGLARLLREGAVFTEAHHEHASTSTAPGHATISTGTTPAHSGIIANEWYDVDSGREIYSAGWGDPSPENLLTSTLGDWMKAADPASKVFSASIKDRSAVMMGGHAADGVYWYADWTPEWESSRAYPPLPEWLLEFNQERIVDRFFGQAWEPLEGAPSPGELGIEEVDTGAYDFRYPHAVGGWTPSPTEAFYNDLQDTPFSDWFLGELGKRIVEHEELGLDGSIDLLALSFSALDYVGHDYGPDSPEVVDTLRRLDRVLGELFDLLDDRLRDRWIVAFSADHGVAPLPEIRSRRGEEVRRLGAEDVVCVQRAGRDLVARYGDGPWFEHGFYLDEETLRRHGVGREEIQREAASLIERCEAVEKVWTAAELSAEPTGSVGPVERRYRASYYPGRSPDLLVQLREGDLLESGLGTTHGSVYPYDSHVPMIFAGPGVRAALHAGRVATIDLAPTFAELIAVPVGGDVDGRSRADVVRGR